MPVWHASLHELERKGKVAVIAIVQDQHPDRARLFLQWKKIDWPVLADSLDLLNLETVPLTLAVDEYGVVRLSELPMAAAATIEQRFVSQTYPKPVATPPAGTTDVSALRAATPRNTADVWRAYGDGLAVFGGDDKWTGVIEAYRHALQRRPSDATIEFRLGSAFRHRYDSAARRSTDFEDAERHWARALDLDPNRYIWRRRVQQYGPRLAEPYPFFDWIRDARAAILARGERPVSLTVEPGDSEFAVSDVHRPVAPVPAPDPDPRGRIRRDRGEFTTVEATAVPPTATPGDAVRIHVTFRPNVRTKAHWNNEADPLVYWNDAPPTIVVDPRVVIVPNATTEVSQEPRTVEYEIKIPPAARPGTLTVPAHALYYVCEDVNGVCLYRRRDVSVSVPILAKPARARESAR